MQQNLINFRQRISEIVQPTSFFKERKRSVTLISEPPQLRKKVQSLHLPEIQLFASLDKSLNLSGFQTALNQIQIFEENSMKKSVILQSPKNRRLQRRGTLLMLDESIQRKFESWQSKFRNKTEDKHIHVILNYFIELFAAMHLKHTKHLIDIYSDVVVQVLQNSSVFIRFTLVIASFCLEMKEYNKASFLCHQIFIVSKILQLNRERTQILLFFGKIHQQMHQYQQSLKFFEESLAYSWFGGYENEEALSYEAIGLSLFYMQQQTKARVFHFKYVNGHFEPQNSPLRIQAVKLITFAEQLQVEKGEKQQIINEIVLSKLALPFQIKERQKIIKKIDQCNCDDIYKIMVAELSEAVQYEYIYQRDVQRVAPKMKIRDNGSFTEKFLETRRKAVLIQWKQRERISSLTIDRNLKEYIQERKKSIQNTETIFQRVKDSIGFKQLKELEPIYIQQHQKKNLIQYIRKEFEQQLIE